VVQGLKSDYTPS